MMMPNSPIQRDLARARRQRFERPTRDVLAVDERSAGRTRRVAGMRIHVGHALIVAGSWLSGERVEAARPSAHRPA